MRVGGCCKVANKYSGSFAPSRWFPPALKHKGECRWCTHTNLTQCPNRVSPMRTASDYQTPAVPYHTLICGSLSTPNTALVRKNAEYITNTCDTWDKKRLRDALAHADEKWRCAHFEQRARSCDSWKMWKCENFANPNFIVASIFPS